MQDDPYTPCPGVPARQLRVWGSILSSLSRPRHLWGGLSGRGDCKISVRTPWGQNTPPPSSQLLMAPETSNFIFSTVADLWDPGGRRQGPGDVLGKIPIQAASWQTACGHPTSFSPLPSWQFGSGRQCAQPQRFTAGDATQFWLVKPQRKFQGRDFRKAF